MTAILNNVESMGCGMWWKISTGYGERSGMLSDKRCLDTTYFDIMYSWMSKVPLFYLEMSEVELFFSKFVISYTEIDESTSAVVIIQN